MDIHVKKTLGFGQAKARPYNKYTSVKEDKNSLSSSCLLLKTVPFPTVNYR